MTVISLLCGAAVAATCAAPAFAAGPPTMALGSVKPGMACTAKTVLRGTQISDFDVEIVDVIGVGTESFILGRASGPAVEATGVAQGFSGSPVYCPADDGTSQIAGAVSAGTGDYGNLLILITPIEAMLAEPQTAVASSRPAGRELGGLLTVTGVSGPVATALRSAARKAGRGIAISPGIPKAASLAAPAELLPGSSVAAGISTGAIELGAVGTVTYVDGNRIWAFGHPLDGAGKRHLMLQNAYVHAVVGNPLTIEGAIPYKLASTLGAIGALTDDRPSGISGVLGTLPRTFPVAVSMRNLDTNALRVEQTEVTDELSLGPPVGATALEQIAPVAVAQASLDALRGAPVQMIARMCVRIRLVNGNRVLSFCNRYAGASPSSPGGGMPVDVLTAATTVAAYRFAPLAIRDVDIRVRIAQRPPLAYLRRVTTVPSRPRPGQRITVRAEAVVQGTTTTIVRTHRIRVPSSARGSLRLRVRGSEPEISAVSPLEETLNVIVDDEPSGSASGPRSISELQKAIKRIERDDRARITFAGQSWRMPLAGNEDVRLAGEAQRTIQLR